jgi:hypothetical protein
VVEPGKDRRLRLGMPRSRGDVRKSPVQKVEPCSPAKRGEFHRDERFYSLRRGGDPREFNHRIRNRSQEATIVWTPFSFELGFEIEDRTYPTLRPNRAGFREPEVELLGPRSIQRVRTGDHDPLDVEL